MIKSILKIGLLLVAGIIVYNYFLGSPEEKESSKQIFHQVRDMGKSVADLVKSEKEKFDKGKYDKAVDKLNDLYKDLRGHARDLNDDYIPKIEELEKQSKKLKEKLKDLDVDASDEGKKASKEIKDELNDLMERTQKMVEEMSEN